MKQGLTELVSGDVLVAATRLDNPADDHAGQGRLLHLDAGLGLKGEIE